MNTESTLRRKVRTIKLMNAEHARNELIESEIEDLKEISGELQPLLAEYIQEIGAEELINRIGPDHWVITGMGDEIDILEVQEVPEVPELPEGVEPPEIELDPVLEAKKVELYAKILDGVSDILGE